MRLPRFRIWILMTVVVLAALASTVLVMVLRSWEYSKIAAWQEAQEISNIKLLRAFNDAVSAMKSQTADRRKEIDDNERDMIARAGVDKDEAKEERLSAAINRARLDDGNMDEVLNARGAAIRAEALRRRAIASAYRRAARYPWLGPPRVNPESE
jgi:hypothetical protein